MLLESKNYWNPSKECEHLHLSTEVSVATTRKVGVAFLGRRAPLSVSDGHGMTGLGLSKPSPRARARRYY